MSFRWPTWAMACWKWWFMPQMALETVMRAGWGMASGDFHTGKQTIQLKGASIELSAAAPVPFHLDGENIGPLPATFSVERRALRVLTP